ncbi:hypothetical protein E2C01_097298 [Portunus trituberculatus]|uniref:Uncharacterized protein n=1 Tax=Portunus trituberculatus TaxID=210409 RepID=A0A5B7KAW2_PORTR|nr:hypothetical protein [Portunus trituberculatus]
MTHILRAVTPSNPRHGGRNGRRRRRKRRKKRKGKRETRRGRIMESQEGKGTSGRWPASTAAPRRVAEVSGGGGGGGGGDSNGSSYCYQLMNIFFY